MELIELDEQIKYWNAFYKDSHPPSNPTSFAEYCLPFIKYKSTLLELGCGNGRDSIYFAKNNISVYASDISSYAINNIKNYVNINNINNMTFINEDFTNFNTNQYTENFQAIYSRFTIHTILQDKISKVFKWSYNALSDGGLIMIETRSTKDPLFASGKGKLIEHNTILYEEGHIRHFVERDELVNSLLSEGFDLVEDTESNNLSIYEGDNPVLLRVIARKN